MIEDRKKSIRNVLIFISVALAVTWVILLLYGIFVQKGKETQLRIIKGHEYSFSIKKQIDDDLESILYEKEQISKNAKRSKIAIFVSNLGTNKTITDKAMSIHENVTLGFMPYNLYNNPQYADAIKSGFEIYLYMPFETNDFNNNDPGQFPILVKNGIYTNLKIIRNLTRNFMGYAGIYGSQRENLSFQQDSFEPIIKYMLERNKLIFLGRVKNDNHHNYFSKYQNIINSDIILDEEPDQDRINENLKKLVSLSKTRGYAIAYVTTYPVTLDILQKWVPRFNALGIDIVTISNILTSK